MKDLFSPSNFIWIIPLGCFGLFIVLLTCYFLRREISSFFKNMFFPDTKRYIVPGAIISKVNTEDKPAAEQKTEDKKEDIQEQAKPADKEDKPLSKEPSLEDDNKGIFRKIETSTRWIFRKIKRSMKHWFAAFAGTEDAPVKTMNASVSKSKDSSEDSKAIPEEVVVPLLLQDTKEEPTKEEGNDTKEANFVPELENTTEDYSSSSEPLTKDSTEENSPEEENSLEEKVLEEEKPQEDKAVEEQEALETPSDTEVKEENKEQEEKFAESLPEPVLPIETADLANTETDEKEAPAPAQQKPAEETKENKENQTEKEDKKPFLSDRTAIIIAMLILAGFVIFLSARVKLLGSIIKRQHVEIKNMQHQLDILTYEQSGVKVVIHERAISPQKRYNK